MSEDDGSEIKILSNETTTCPTSGSRLPRGPADEVGDLVDEDFFTLHDLDLAMMTNDTDEAAYVESTSLPTVPSCDAHTWSSFPAATSPQTQTEPRVRKLVKMKVSDVKCSYCGQEFSSVKGLISHNSTHHAGKLNILLISRHKP